MVAISLDAAGRFRRQKGDAWDRPQKTIAIRPDAKETRTGMSRTDVAIVLRFARIVSHAWVTLIGNPGAQIFVLI
jgi:hypothetical protein